MVHLDSEHFLSGRARSRVSAKKFLRLASQHGAPIVQLARGQARYSCPGPQCSARHCHRGKPVPLVDAEFPLYVRPMCTGLELCALAERLLHLTAQPPAPLAQQAHLTASRISTVPRATRGMSRVWPTLWLGQRPCACRGTGDASSRLRNGSHRSGQRCLKWASSGRAGFSTAFLAVAPVYNVHTPTTIEDTRWNSGAV